ncbi:hypothetical protein K469DRAFT_378110 [Zopfia rhizophila CBS 207.26]|uniref:Uncharacterized protein n=1 Tax=Zopfia rhizophila CBS 207.26 TaxID=1314779 RepID=A0A6A6DCS2_9PEZI|nr:hypothetical protein K469DRAFT_378110 [Zopfia rhizophila CBS 207.26]
MLQPGQPWRSSRLTGRYDMASVGDFWSLTGSRQMPSKSSWAPDRGPAFLPSSFPPATIPHSTSLSMLNGCKDVIVRRTVGMVRLARSAKRTFIAENPIARGGECVVDGTLESNRKESLNVPRDGCLTLWLSMRRARTVAARHEVISASGDMVNQSASEELRSAATRDHVDEPK